MERPIIKPYFTADLFSDRTRYNTIEDYIQSFCDRQVFGCADNVESLFGEMIDTVMDISAIDRSSRTTLLYEFAFMYLTGICTDDPDLTVETAQDIPLYVVTEKPATNDGPGYDGSLFHLNHVDSAFIIPLKSIKLKERISNHLIGYVHNENWYNDRDAQGLINRQVTGRSLWDQILGGCIYGRNCYIGFNEWIEKWRAHPGYSRTNRSIGLNMLKFFDTPWALKHDNRYDLDGVIHASQVLQVILDALVEVIDDYALSGYTNNVKMYRDTAIVPINLDQTIERMFVLTPKRLTFCGILCGIVFASAAEMSGTLASAAGPSPYIKETSTEKLVKYYLARRDMFTKMIDDPDSGINDVCENPETFKRYINGIWEQLIIHIIQHNGLRSSSFTSMESINPLASIVDEFSTDELITAYENMTPFISADMYSPINIRNANYRDGMSIHDVCVMASQHYLRGIHLVHNSGRYFIPGIR